MLRQSFSLLAVAALSLTVLPSFAQTPPAAPATAATVNGTPIYETAVQRLPHAAGRSAGEARPSAHDHSRLPDR